MITFEGKVIKSTGIWYRILSGENVIEARLKGIFRLDENVASNPVVVGDRVKIEYEDDRTAVISEILPRENYIIRKGVKYESEVHILASNIEQAILMVTPVEPRTPMGFIDRFLVAADAFHIPVIICFNKIDLLNQKKRKKLDEWKKIYLKVGYNCIEISATDVKHKNTVIKILKDKTTLLAGNSGTGKSTLANLVDESLHLKTEEVSQLTEKGKHVTTYVEMFPLSFGGFIVDSPGLREFGIVDIPQSEISHYFPEMRKVLHGCKFHNCVHIHEPNCAVKKAVEQGLISVQRYESYQNIFNSIE